MAAQILPALLLSSFVAILIGFVVAMRRARGGTSSRGFTVSPTTGDVGSSGGDFGSGGTEGSCSASDGTCHASHHGGH